MRRRLRAHAHGWRGRGALAYVRPELLLRQILVRVASLDANNERALMCAVALLLLCQPLLGHTVRGVHGLVPDQPRQQLHPVHHRMVRQRARELDHVLDL
jgi:hypothetical protein